MKVYMKLNPRPFELIESGVKTIELRLNDAKRQMLNVGDVIRFSNIKNYSRQIYCRITNIYYFKNFEELYASLPLLKCGYTAEDVDKASPADMNDYYSKEEIEKYGVVGIELEKYPFKEANRQLVERYPFLLPRNRWTGEVPEDYDYSYTELEAMPIGWLNAFGMDMVEELRSILIKGNFLERYRILQIKEKYGYLRWYHGGIPEAIFEEHHAWLHRYEKLSERICIVCGKPATVVSVGWIFPYCNDCKNNDGDYVDIDEYYRDEND